jgi:hypothetical protein
MRPMIPMLVCLVTSAIACASTPGAQPHDMSAASHEGMASAEDKSAAAHAAQYDPEAAAEKVRCGGTNPACWTSLENPTTEHRQMAAQHRKAAADHRAASKALRDAEASACAGLSEQDRDMSPFAHREDIAGVEELKSPPPYTKAPAVLGGAVISFRAVPGMTAQWLKRVIDCHIARSAALGHNVPEMPYCPLVPKDVTATVTATDKGFAVALESKDADVAREILKRANALVGR